MRKNCFEYAAELKAQGKPFVLATVIRREPPISTKPGDKAIVTPDGTFTGWVGGSCAQPTVVSEALQALQDGQPRLILLTPDSRQDTRSGVTVFPMTCHSGGTVEIYLEPFLAPPRLVLMGASPIVEALTRLGSALGYRVWCMDPTATEERFPEATRVQKEIPMPAIEPNGETYAVVATMGHFDEEALQAVLASEPLYVGMVASPKRFGQICQTLENKGVSTQTLKKVKNPAGLDINAKLPEEVALSILAEIIQTKRSQMVSPIPIASADTRFEQIAKDPICGMMVDLATARHTAQYNDKTYYFCCGGCRESFQGNPEQYLAVEQTANHR